jgi:hypothetical protein
MIVIILTHMGKHSIEPMTNGGNLTQKKLLGHVEANLSRKSRTKKKSGDQIANIVLISFLPYYFLALAELGFPRKHSFKT